MPTLHMLRSLLVALSLYFLGSGTLVLAEIPLTSPVEGPALTSIIGVTAHAHGFLVITRRYTATRDLVFASRLAPSGEPLDAHPTLVYAAVTSGASRYALRSERGGPLLEVTTTIADGLDHDYEIERLALDAETGQVTTRDRTFREDWEPFIPKNASGETIAIQRDANGARSTIFFVGADGVRRKPTTLPGLQSHWLTAIPYGEDEWIILALQGQGNVWYRISEARRLEPLTRYVNTSLAGSHWNQTVASANGELAVLTEVVSGSYSDARRTLTLHVIDPSGGVTKHTLIADEVLQNPKFQPVYPSSVAATKDGSVWTVAYSWWNTAGTNELRMWRVTSFATLTRHDTYQDRSVQGSSSLVLVTGATHNLLLFSKPATFGDRTIPHVRHQYDWLRGSAIPTGETAHVFMPEPTRQSEVRTAAGPSGLMVVWTENETDSYVRFFAANGIGGEPIRLTSPPYRGKDPVVTWNGDTFAVAWLEWLFPDAGSPPERQRVLLRRFDALGKSIDAEPLVLWNETQSTAMPDEPGLAVGAEGDGVRVAWNARPPSSSRPEPTVFTTYVGSRDREFAQPTSVTPAHVRAVNPILVSNGTETLLIWKEGSASGSFFEQRTVSVYAKRHVGGDRRGGPFRLTRASRLAAAAHDGEFLLVTVAGEGGGYCTRAQRFSFAGAQLADAVTLDCRAGVDASAPDPSVVWDAGRWWVAPAALEITDLHQVSSDGTAGALYRMFDEATPSLETSLVPTGRGPSAVYIRVERELDFIERAFIRPFPRPRSRAVRR